MRVYKRTPKSRKWEVSFRDGENIIRRLTLFSDKAASEEAGRKIERLVAMTLAGEKPDFPLVKWLEVCPENIIVRLAGWGIVEHHRAAVVRDLKDHLTEWKRHMTSKGFAPRYVGCVSNIVARSIDFCRWRGITDISRESFKEYLAHLAGKARSLDTLNHQIKAVKAFCNWLIQETRMTENPFSRFPMFNIALDRRRERRPLSPEELSRLVQAAENGKARTGLTGHERALIYLLAVETGLRWSEIRSLVIADFCLEGEAPGVTIQANNAKNRRQDTLSLRPELARELASHFSGRGEQELAFPGMTRDGGVIIMRHDLKSAGIPYQDALKRTADFHALRHTLATMLCKAGVPLTTAQRIMRHSDPKLTSNIYNHVEVNDKAEAVAKLPDFFRSGEGKNRDTINAKKQVKNNFNENTDTLRIRAEPENKIDTEILVRKPVRGDRDHLGLFVTNRDTTLRTTEKVENLSMNRISK